MRRNHVGGYRGRKTGRDFLKYIILALLLVVAVLAGLLLFGGEKPPREEQEQQGQEQQQTPTQPSEQPTEPTELPTEPEPEVVYMAAIGVDAAQVLDGSWKSAVEQAGANAVVLDMKPDNGVLNWNTAQTLSISAGAQNNTEGLNDRLRQLNDGDVYTVARMSCFRDELTANLYECCIHSNSGYRWQDFGKVHWVSPAHSGVQDNLVGLAVELAELGFDEILLDYCGYPRNGSGEMGWIKRGPVYDLENLDVVVSAFLSKMEKALEPYGTRLAIRTGADVVANDGDLTGVTGAVLEQHAERIWMSEVDTDAPLAEVLSLAGVTRVGERLVIETAELVPEGTWEQAVLNF